MSTRYMSKNNVLRFHVILWPERQTSWSWHHIMDVFNKSNNNVISRLSEGPGSEGNRITALSLLQELTWTSVNHRRPVYKAWAADCRLQWLIRHFLSWKVAQCFTLLHFVCSSLLTNMRRCRAHTRPMEPFWSGPQMTSTVGCFFVRALRG